MQQQRVQWALPPQRHPRLQEPQYSKTPLGISIMQPAATNLRALTIA